MSKIIVPTCCNGEKITSQCSRNLIKSGSGRQDQIDGLVYYPFQMPSSKKNNMWDHVIRRPAASQTKQPLRYCIETEDGFIHIQFILEKVDVSIKKAAVHFLNNHSKVREIKGESGDMSCAGLRVDLVKSSIVHYVSNNNSVHISQSNRILKEGARKFHEILQKSCCNNSVQMELNRLEKSNNIIRYGKEKKFYILHIYSVKI